MEKNLTSETCDTFKKSLIGQMIVYQNETYRIGSSTNELLLERDNL
jgi:hypothetical protein